MTLGEVLSRFSALKPHDYPERELRAWLWELEQMIYREVQRPRMPEGQTPPEPITMETPESRVLLAEDPYGQIYLLYLATQVDLHQSEPDRYAFDAALFNAAYLQYAHAYAREHLPVTMKEVKA